MAKTIAQLTELAATPDATDELVIADGGVTKKISVSNLVSAALNLSGNKTVFDGVNLVLGTTTGTKLGTGDDAEARLLQRHAGRPARRRGRRHGCRQHGGTAE
jgi:hypothetical protein